MPERLAAADFAGDWLIARAIADRHAAQTGRFDGRAWFTPTGPDHFRYREDGVLHLGAGPAMTATRAYGWAFDGARVAVTFADGRPFHSFPLAGGPGEDHPCGEDLYRVAYDFSRWPVWEVTWTVSGPRKDYTMTSCYRRR